MLGPPLASITFNNTGSTKVLDNDAETRDGIPEKLKQGMESQRELTESFLS